MYFILKKSRKLISGACGNVLGIVRNSKIYIGKFIIMKEFFVKDDWYLAVRCAFVCCKKELFQFYFVRSQDRLNVLNLRRHCLRSMELI